jgi:8-oxo-dGTP pyrophosphatase MutT (NUDIX family)
MNPERLISSGGVVFRRSNSQVFYLLLGFKRRNIWCLPKGLIEPGESEIDAATREVREETGVNSLKLVDKIGVIRYQFGYRDKRFDKTVHFFLFETDQVETTVGTEHDMYSWLPYDKAILALSYPNERDILEKANEMMKTPSSNQAKIEESSPQARET